MSWAHVQGGRGGNGSTSSTAASATTGSAVATGNVVALWTNGTLASGNAAQPTITNSGTATLGAWVHVVGGNDSADGGVNRLDYFAAPVTAGGTLTVTATYGAATFVTLLWDEYSGLQAAASGTGAVAGVSGTSLTATMAVATVEAGDLVACAGGSSGDNIWPATPTGYAARQSTSGMSPADVADLANFDKSGASATAESVTLTWSVGHHYIAGIAALKLAASATPAVRDTATRFRLAAAATSWRDAAARFRLAARSWRDTATRFRLLRQPPPVQHVLMVLLENQPYAVDGTNGGGIVGNSSAPYLNATIMPRYATASQYYALAHPSLPNYLALTSGSTQGQTTDYNLTTGTPYGGSIVGAANLFTALTAAGKAWKVYAQSLPSAYAVGTPVGDAGGNDGSGNALYQEHHNPAVYYSQVNSSATELAKVVTDNSGTSGVSGGLTALLADLAAGTLPAFSFVVPDMAHDMHDPAGTQASNNAGVAAGDTWLSTFLPHVTASPAWPTTAVLIVADESAVADTSGPGGGHVLAVWVSPYARAGYTGTATYDHRSALRTVEWLLGVAPFAAGDAAAVPMDDLFATAGDRDATARFRLSAVAWRNSTTRFRLFAGAWRDYAGRFRLSAAGWRDASSRFRLSAAAWRDSTARFTIGITNQAWRSTSARFALRAGATRDAVARFALRAGATRDAVARFRLSATAWRDSVGRFRLSAAAWRDSAGRFRLAVGAWRDSAARFAIGVSSQAWRSTSARFALRATAWRDGVVRFRLSARSFRDATSRFRLSAVAWRDSAVRFAIGIPNQRIRDTATRFGLSARTFRDAALRFRLSVGSWRDASSRFRLSAMAWRDSVGRFRLAVRAWSDATARFAFSSTVFHDTQLRFRLAASGDIGGQVLTSPRGRKLLVSPRLSRVLASFGIGRAS